MDLKETLEFIMTGNPSGVLKANEEASASFAETGAASKASAEETKAASSGMSSGTVVAGAAVVGALFEMGKKWDEAALSAGKMADATGLTSEQASRWSVVAKNSDVDTSALEKSIGFMNKTAGNAPQKFTDLGIALKNQNGEARSTNDVFLSVIDRLNSIKDPQERAAEGARLLGKGWMSLAELVGEGSDKLVKDMADVNDAQVFGDDKVEQAKKFRDMLKEVSNEFQSLTLKVGEFVADIAPAVGGVADFVGAVESLGTHTEKNASTFEKVKDGILKYGNLYRDIYVETKKVVEISGDLADQFRENHGVTAGLSDELVAHADAIGRVKGSAGELTAELLNMKDRGFDAVSTGANGFSASLLAMSDRGRDGGEALSGMAVELERLKVDADDAATAYKTLMGDIDSKKAYANAEAALASLQEKMKDKKPAAEQQAQLLEVEAAMATYIKGLDGIPDSKKTKMYAELDAGNVVAVQAEIDQITKDRQLTIFMNTARGQVGYMKNASGTNSSPGGLTEINDQGPEIIDMPAGAVVHTATESAQMRSQGGTGGGVVHLNFYGPVMGEQDFIQRIHDGMVDGVRRGVLIAAGL